MNRRNLAPGAFLALALLLLFAAPSAHADRPPIRQPLHIPYDSDPEVPNRNLLAPKRPDGQSVLSDAPRGKVVSVRIHAQRAAAWILVRAWGGILR